MTVSELTKILAENGCFPVGHGANHDKWQSSVSGRCFYVPRHPSKELKKGTLHNIFRLAGLKGGLK